jgi:hypothetical protein
MSTVTDVLFRLRRKGVRLWIDGGQLKFEAPPRSLNADEILRLKELKSEIVDFLRQPSDFMTEPRLEPRLPSDRVPLTFSQVWLWNKLKWDERPSRAGMVAKAMRISGRLNVDLLRRSLTELVRRHESLRTRLVKVDDMPTQQVDAACECDLQLVHLTGLSKLETESEVNRIAGQLSCRAAPVAAGRLFETRLVKLRSHDHLLIVALDHIISDGASLGILFRDVFSLYTQLAQALPCTLPKIPIQFADYAVWQRKAQKYWVQKHDAHWRQRLAGARRMRLAARGIPDTNSPTPLKLPFRFDETLSKQLRDFSRQARTTLVMCVLAVYAASLMRFYNEADIVIPFICLGRHHFEVENTIGFFGAPLFLRIALLENDSLLDLLDRTTHEYRIACEHHDFCRIAAQTPEPEFTWNPMFNWLTEQFNMGSTTSAPDPQNGGDIKIEPYELEITPPDDVRWDGELRVDISDTPQGLVGTLGYRADCFTGDAIERFRACFQSLAAPLVRGPRTRIAIRPPTT